MYLIDFMRKNGLVLVIILSFSLAILSGCGKNSNNNINQNQNGNTNVSEALTISQISPTAASVNGGQMLMIYGTGFSEGIKVFIDNPGVYLVTPNIINSHVVQVIIPAHAQGSVVVGIMDQNGKTVSLPPIFNYR